ncbi:MAG: AI-2E family transporter [Longimicrobiales bacterium]
MNRKPYALLIATIFALLLLLFLHSIAEVLLLLFIAILFCVFLSAITDSLQRRFSVPRPLGVMIALTIFLLGLTGIIVLIVPPVISQTRDLVGAMPTMMAGWEVQLKALAARNPMVANMLPEIHTDETYVGMYAAQMSGYLKGLVPWAFSAVTIVIHFLSVLVMGIYLALKPSIYREGFIVLAPPIHRDLVRDILADLNRTLRAWIVGQLLAMFVLGVLTWIGLELLNVPYALAFGVFTGAAAVVPFFGTLFSTILPAFFVLGTGGPLTALWVILLGVVVHLFEANVVAPMIMERQVHLPPVLSILAVLIMSHLLHVIGLLVAVPVLCVVMVIGRRVYVHRVLEGRGFRRAIRDRPVELQLPGDGAVLVHPLSLERSIPTMLEG